MDYSKHMEQSTPRVGQLLYHEERDAEGKIKSAWLYFIDTEPEPDKQWMVTWVAQMNDSRGNGMEVDTAPIAGGAGRKHMTRVATDDDIRQFVNVIKGSKNPEEQISLWIKRLEGEGDLSLLLEEEKERLKRILRDQHSQEQ